MGFLIKPHCISAPECVLLVRVFGNSFPSSESVPFNSSFFSFSYLFFPVRYLSKHRNFHFRKTKEEKMPWSWKFSHPLTLDTLLIQQKIVKLTADRKIIFSSFFSNWYNSLQSCFSSLLSRFLDLPDFEDKISVLLYFSCLVFPLFF